MATAPSTIERSPAHAECTHCGLPVPAELFAPNQDEQFCCHGCQTAYQILQEDQELLESLQARREASAAARRELQNYSYLDHPSFAEAHCRDLGSGVAQTRFLLEGVLCASCVFAVEKLPRFLPGVIRSQMNLTSSQATIDWRPDEIKLSDIARTLDRLGYPPHPVTEDGQERLERQELHRQLIRLAVAGACAGNTMLIAVTLYLGFFSGMSSEFLHLFRWTSAGIAAVCLVWPGSVFFRGAWQAFRSGTPHMDLPVALGLAAGAIMGLVNTFLGRGEIYFDSLTVLIFLLLVGRYLQYAQQRRALHKISLLKTLLPRSVFRLTAHDPEAVDESIPLEAVRPGDWIRLRAGDVVPSDGTIVDGSSLVDQSMLTGESRGVPVRVGDRVLSGATNMTGPLVIEAESIGADTRLSKIFELVEDGLRSKTPIVQFANWIGGYFVVVVLLLAAITVAIWASSGWELAINHAMALLIVACPCALGLATPFTVAIAQGRAAARGILIKSGDVFERLAGPGIIWLDKTGTLTQGRMQVVSLSGEESVMPLVALLERSVIHPIAEAIARKYAAPSDVSVTEFESIPGIGLQGYANGSLFQVGSERILADASIAIPDRLWRDLNTFQAEGYSTVVVIRDGEVVTVCALGDQIRPDAKPTVDRLKAMGWQVGMLSGDHQRVADSVGRAIGISPELTMGDLSPEDKLSVIQKSAAEQTVVMVGDGVNDSIALATASVGIAVDGGAEVSLKAANVYLTTHGISPILEVISGSRQTLRTIHRNFAVSLSYNGAAVLLCMLGLINPIVAAVLMPISSLTVLAISASNPAFSRQRSQPKNEPLTQPALT
ncbi:heavy metal translocating P-type ATPase [Blastopirellula marina]|uniref:Copper-translocating P-type ATPase n=1 Tax=Blastopirellula marina TaxID=124 RepID=A0A2S8F6W9_9BACT|nr:heavy metal translocating P-type ATPase [Blastopirellula marina]PQO27896.1 copper-translocating P-type ATPase [Blastopirellula marina]PTL41632.1 heavy metal translocating P-type ATPase [Blastopirellula marina]